MNHTKFMPLPELYYYLLNICPDIIPDLMGVDKFYDLSVKKYILGLIVKYDRKEFDKLMEFFIDHDIVYGCYHLNKTFYCNLINYDSIIRSCKMKSYRVTSFLFKYSDYGLIKIVYQKCTPFALVVQTFYEKGLINRLKELVGRVFINDILTTVFMTLDFINDTDIQSIMIRFLIIFVKCHNLKIRYLVNHFYDIGFTEFNSQYLFSLLNKLGDNISHFDLHQLFEI